MGLKSKSVVTIIILAFVGILAFGTGAFVLTRAKSNRFAEDGYILMAEPAGDADSTVTSSPVWFGAGNAYTSGTTGISFTDAQGNAVTVDEDSFVHYTDDSVSAVKSTVVMDLDNYVQDYIQYYYLEQGNAVTSDNGAYYIKAQENAPSFSNFLMKSSDLHYLLGSPVMYFVRSSDADETVITSGYVEITYLSDDYSIALINDGSSAWQMLTENAYIQLENGVKFELSSGALSYGGTESEEESTYYVGEIDVDVNLNVAVYSSTVYPTYRFTVVNGADGQNGEDGDAGDNGEAGIRGEQGEAGADGTTAGEGTAGENGGSGTQGSIAGDGFSGGLWDGVEVVGTVPVVQIREWSIAGSVLHFIAYMDEDSCDLIEEGTSSILLEDLDAGTSTEWTERGDEYGQSVDFSEDNSDGFEFYYSRMVPGHSYRMTISATYTLNGIKNTQALLVRNFTADDYGVVFNRISSDSKSVTYSIELTNSNVTLDTSGAPVTVTVNGNEYKTGIANWTTEELKGITILYANLDPDSSNEVNYAGQTMDIAFAVNVIVNSYDYANNEYKMSGKETIAFEDTVKVRKNQPTVGGVRLTAYNSGLFLAEVLGEYDHEDGTYNEVDDTDEAITSIRFELYDAISQSDEAKCAELSNLVETIEVTSGYIGYFPVTDSDGGSGVSLNHRYYVRAYCVIDDGEMISELPVKETRENTETEDGAWISNIDNVSYKHAAGEMAWDYAILNNITSTSISFVGNDGIYNTADNTQNKGITFNRLSGSIYAVIAANSDYYISTDCPIEIQISAAPDYYVSLKYDNIGAMALADKDSSNRDVYLASEVNKEADTKPIKAVNNSGKEIAVKLPIDLTGLKANTTYLVNMYGYENPTKKENPSKSDLDRVIMGSMAISTADTRNITVSLKQDTSVTLTGGIGCILTLGEEGATNYYDSDKNEYTNKTEYMANTDAAYRSLASITLDLYLEADKSLDASLTDTLVGTCVIDTSGTTNASGSDPDYNSIYEEFFRTSTKGLIGVGSSFKYNFKDPKNKSNIITLQDLKGGTYYIVVSGACDYTETRYNYHSEENNPYTYYGWRSAQSQYVNNLVINGGVEEKISNLEIKTTPFILPDALMNRDGNYITVEQITNSEAYMCNYTDYTEDTTAEKLYCSSWDADTVVGLKLTTNYKQQGSGSGATTNFTFYGFTVDKYNAKQTSGNALIEKASDSDQEKGLVYSDNFFFSYEFPLSDNPEMVGDYAPEVWLMFYDPEVNESIYDNIGETPVNGAVGYINTQTIKNPDPNAKCPTVQVIYMDKSVFTRGQSFYFAYDAELSYYEWEYEDKEGIMQKQTGFHFPADYYEYYDSDANYNFGTSLKSAKVTVDRQTPVIYSWLENTDSNREDNWSVYISDPDNAIEWDSLLNAGILDSYQSSKGGIFGYNQKLQTTISLSSSEDGNGYNTIKSNDVYEEKVTYTEDGDPVSLPADATVITESVLNRFAQNLTREGGGKLRVGGLPDTGLIYNVYLNYKLRDDGDEKLLRVISHNYMGAVTIRGDRASTPTFALTLDDGNADHNTMRIYFEAPEAKSNLDSYYAESEYLSAIESIAAVRIRAKIKNANDASASSDVDVWSYIKEQVKDPETGTYKPGDSVKDVWVVPTAPEKADTVAEGETADALGYTDYRYYLEFALSDFDDTSNTQYRVGDEICYEVLIYYATGESVKWTADENGNYTIDTAASTEEQSAENPTGYVARYVDHASAQGDVYGSGNKRISGYYVVADKANQLRSTSAAKSFYQIAGSMKSTLEAVKGTNKKQLVWTQNTRLISETFNQGYTPQHEATLRKNLSDDIKSVTSESSDAVEILMTNTASYSTGLTMTVQSFVPQMGNFSATPGMTTVNISGTVKNARLVEYPEDETFHMYYLVYEVLSGTDTAAGSSEADREVLVGAMVGEPKNVSLAESGNLNIDFVLEQKKTYHIKIYYKTKENLTSGTPFSDQIDAKVFTKTYTLNNASITRTAQKGTFYENGAISTNDSFNMAKHIEDQINNNSAVFVPIPGIDANGIYVTTRDGITISSTAIDLNTSTTPAEGAQTQGTTIANGRTLKFTTSIASEIVESEQPSLRIFYRLERIAQNDYTDPSRTKDGSDTNKWETVIADSREPEEVLKALTWSNNDEYSGREADAGTGSSSFNQAHFWQYYDDEPDTNGQDLSYAPNPDAISSINTMQMPYYTGGLITPGYYYRVTTRIYQKVGDTYTNVTVSTDGNNQEDPHAESTPELWSAWSTAAGSSKLKTVLSYAESDAITITFGLYDVNDTSVDGKYFVRLAKLEGDEWKVVDATTSKVKIENAGMSYDQAFYMNQSYTKVKFTGLDASSTYRLQFYAAFDTDYDNHIDATEMSASAVSDSYLTGNLTSDILTLDTYYPRQKSSELKAPVSTLGETNGAYEDAFKNKNPYGNSGQLTFAQSSLLAGISGETETMSDDLQAYAGSYTNMYTIKGSNTIWLNYLGAFNTDEIDKISYDVALTTTTGSVQYVSHEIYANDTQDTYGSFSFSNTNGKVTLKLTLNTESEIADEGVASAPLNWMSNKGEYTIILRFYSAKRDADNKIVTDQSSGDPIYVLMKKDGDLDPVFTVQ